MQENWSYAKNSDDFLKKNENIGKIPKDVILFTTDVLRLYPSIFQGTGLEAQRKRINERKTPRVDFVLKNNGEVKRLKSGTDIGTKFAPSYEPVFAISFMAPLYSQDIFYVDSWKRKNCLVS